MMMRGTKHFAAICLADYAESSPEDWKLEQ